MAGFWLQVLAEALASLPVFGLGLWFSHRRLRRHVDTVTDHQTRQLATHLRKVTDEQTAQLEGSRRP